MLRNRRISVQINSARRIGNAGLLVFLFVASVNTEGKLITTSLHKTPQDKLSDITTSEKRIAANMLATVSLFCRADVIVQACTTAYQGEIGKGTIRICKRRGSNYGPMSPL